MKKPRQANRRIRKRTFVVTGLVLLAVLLAATLLSFYATTLVGPADLVRFSISEGSSRTVLLGSGISLGTAEPANLLLDTSFEPLVFRQALTVFSGDETTLTVSSEDASAGLYGDGFFDGASARVMSQTRDGMALKKTARVAHYGINRVGVFQPVSLPGDVPAKAALLAFARRGDLSIAVGERGLIIRNVTGQTPEVVESGVTADLSGVCAAPDGFLACSEKGDILFSSNGTDWESLAKWSSMPLSAIAASDTRLMVAVGASGAILAGSIPAAGDALLSDVETDTEADLHDIAFGLSTFVVVGDNGTILISQTGLLWHTVKTSSRSNWRTVEFRDGCFVLAGDKGAVAVSEDGRTFQLASSEDQTDFVDLVMMSRQQLIGLDDRGNFHVSNDRGDTWLSSGIDTGMTSRVIALAGKDKILSADADGRLGLAQLVAEIQLDSSLREGQYQAGDQIFLEKVTGEIPSSYLTADGRTLEEADPWDFFGSGSCIRQGDAAAPGGGDASLLLRNDPARPGQDAIVSQQVSRDLLADARTNETFTVSLWMKQSDVADRQVQVWVTGAFNPIGTAFTNVGTTWKLYSYTFVLPFWAISPENRDIRLNIAIANGSLWIDRVSLCRAGDDPELLSLAFRKEISDIAPRLVRLDYLAIGRQTVRPNSWAHEAGNETSYLSAAGLRQNSSGSLRASLEMAEESGADPWLVLDAYTSEAEVNNLLEYLAGPISEPYGKLRQDQGMILPWTGAFKRVLLEIVDSHSVYSTDRAKADFVDLIIRTVTRSPYYRDIRGQLIFVDGMGYRDGVMLSTADYHASDLSGLVRADRADAVASALLDYYDQIPRNPEKPVQTWLEMIRTAGLRPNGTNLPNLADLTELLLRDLGSHSILSNLALPARDSQEWQACWAVAARIASSAARGTPLAVSTPSDAVFAYGYSDAGQLTIILTNLSGQPATCQLITDLPLQQATMEKYDADGTLLARQTLRQRDRKIAVLPGGVVVIRKALGSG